jgi:hypothetical protein
MKILLSRYQMKNRFCPKRTRLSIIPQTLTLKAVLYSISIFQGNPNQHLILTPPIHARLSLAGFFLLPFSDHGDKRVYVKIDIDVMFSY